MAAHHLLLLLVAVLLPAAATADPDAVQDYCVPDTGGRGRPVELALLPSYPCRSPANLTASDFAFAGVRAAGNFSADTGFAGVSVTPAQFPALHTLGMSFARADLSAAGGVNPPHYHPRATETALVLAGRVYAGFVDSGGRIFAKVLEKGEVMVFPRAMVHFQMNVGDEPATVFGTFNSENPGIVRIPATVFGSGIKGGILERAFGLSPEELRRLEKRFGPPKTKQDLSIVPEAVFTVFHIPHTSVAPGIGHNAHSNTWQDRVGWSFAGCLGTIGFQYQAHHGSMEAGSQYACSLARIMHNIMQQLPDPVETLKASWKDTNWQSINLLNSSSFPRSPLKDDSLKKQLAHSLHHEILQNCNKAVHTLYIKELHTAKYKEQQSLLVPSKLV